MKQTAVITKHKTISILNRQPATP